MCTNAILAPAAETTPVAHFAGTCPCCQESELHYGESGLADAQYYYNWNCPECEATGTEWFELVFIEHTLKTPGSHTGE